MARLLQQPVKKLPTPISNRSASGSVSSGARAVKDEDESVLRVIGARWILSHRYNISLQLIRVEPLREMDCALEYSVQFCKDHMDFVYRAVGIMQI